MAVKSSNTGAPHSAMPPGAPETHAGAGGTLRSYMQFRRDSRGARFPTHRSSKTTAEQAEARFKTRIGRYLLALFSNPTTAIFGRAMRMLEGAECCARHVHTAWRGHVALRCGT